MVFSVPLSRSANRELKYRGGEDLQKRVIRKSGNGSPKALYFNKKVEANLFPLPVRSRRESLSLPRELIATSPGRTFTVVTVSFPALRADVEAPREGDFLCLPGTVCLIPDVGPL